eukprot:Pompholyxophrys_sp_v1_NODE_2_length_20472_cov_5.132586.p9 type:complete len:275 gc:universal NODE_2_length_20472_cov_5.132586:6029-6853(+)
MPKPIHFAMFHGENNALEPLSYQKRNNTTIIVCGTEGEVTHLNPVIWFLQYYSQFYPDFVEEFLHFHYKYLGGDYFNTYKEQKVSNEKYNPLFKMMMREHFLFLKSFPFSTIQIFERRDSIANLTLLASEDVELNFTTPTLNMDLDKFTRSLNVNNFTSHYNYQVVAKTQGDPNYFKRLDTWVDGKLTFHNYSLPMALTNRRMNIIEVGKKTNVSNICQTLPSNGILVLTACRGLNQVMKTQIYKPSPSLQQVIEKLQKLQLKQKQDKKRRRQR